MAERGGLERRCGCGLLEAIIGCVGFFTSRAADGLGDFCSVCVCVCVCVCVH